MTLKFKAFTPESFAATKRNWIKDVEGGAGFLPDTEQQLAWTENHLELVENSIAYGVFKDKSDVAIGICELVITKHTPKRSWVKVIRLRLRPKIEAALFANEQAAIATAIEAYAVCVVGVLHLKNAHNASTIKVYGRTQDQLKLISFMNIELQKNKEVAYQSSIEGRWLVLKWSKP